MKEDVEHFMDRIYVNFKLECALVFPESRFKGKPERWTLEQARQYLFYLNQDDGDIII